MTTLRQHLEAIRDDRDCWCFACGNAEEHAVAALAQLDQSERFATGAPVSIGPPDERGQSIIRAGPLVDTGFRFVLDPELKLSTEADTPPITANQQES